MNRNLFASDCLNILHDQDILPDGSVDLIYLDPPFNSNSTYNLPFKGKDKTLRPVEAFKDTWEWGDKEETLLERYKRRPQSRHLGNLIEYSLEISGGRASKNNLGAYLVNMAARLEPMKRVLSDSGSIYLHCDPTASHYLKSLMDGIFGHRFFHNELVWCYSWPRNTKSYYARTHDVLLFYSKSDVWTFNPDDVRQPYSEASQGREEYAAHASQFEEVKLDERGKLPQDWIVLPPIRPNARERLGYPTQKPLSLLRHIILASSNEGDLVLDPFCGCGTTLHAAEFLKRRWVGIDASSFAAGLVRERILSWIPTLNASQIQVFGTPNSTEDAMKLANRDRFEFEKWVCGFIGAHGMYRDPGERGPDAGVDGVIEFYPINIGEVSKPDYAIVQVKSGTVTPDAVGRLYDTVKKHGVKAGILVCFGRFMQTVENNRNRETFHDSLGTYPVIQGVSVEDLLAGKKINLPPFVPRSGGKAPSTMDIFQLK